MIRTLLAMVGAAVLMTADLRAGTEEGWDASMRMFMSDAVHRIYLSAELADIGREQSDPLLLVAAARLKAWTAGRVDDFHPRFESNVIAFEKNAGPSPARFDHSTEGLLAAARALAAGDPREQALVEATVLETTSIGERAGFSGPRFQQMSLPPGGRVTVQIKYYLGGGAVTIVGSSLSKLDLIVRNRSGNVVCEDRGWSDYKLCGWNVEQASDYWLIVENPGPRAADFRLYVN